MGSYFLETPVSEHQDYFERLPVPAGRGSD
jgi:hypothetical protein